MIGEILAWFRAQLDEDEASDWPHRPTCQMLQPVPFGSMSCNCDAADQWQRDIAAKRQILAEYTAARQRCARHPGDVASSAALLTMLRVVKLLAEAYARRSGYREEWAP